MHICTMKFSSRTLGFATLAVLLAACGSPPLQEAASPPPPANPRVESAVAPLPTWPAFVETFIEEYFRANPAYAVGSGRHDFDGQLPDWSRAGIQREIERLGEWRSKALLYGKDALTSAERFQRDYLLSRIDRDQFWLRDAAAPFTNPAFYFDNGLDPSTYVVVPYAPAEQRVRAFIQYLRAIPGALAQMRANLQTPLPRSFIDYGIAGFNGFASFYRGDALTAFAGLDAALQLELQQAVEPAAQAMQAQAAWLEQEKNRATSAFALGPQRFSDMLRMTEAVTTPLARLEQIGREDLERNLAALAAACKAYAPGRALQACVDKVGTDKPRGGPVNGARKQLAELRQFIVEHRIVTIPGTQQALVEEAPAYRRQNFAFINIPGPYEQNLPSVYYIAPPDPQWSKIEQDAYVPGKADLLFTSVHEVWPGHFLQFLHSNRSSWRFGQLFVGYAFAEGWAHYAEELMVEAGIAQSRPDLQIGQALNALLRNVRYLCAIGLHTQGMSAAQCEQLFRDKAYQDAGNARQQAARGTYDPAYLNYTLGKLMIRKLRADWESSHPGQVRQTFHDQLLSFGGPPIPLVRARMLEGAAGELF
jgi:uncharacterized protein (DUF885 family)